MGDRGEWWLQLRRPQQSWKRFALAIALTASAYLTQALVWETVPPSPYLLFYPAVFFTAWWLGRRPAVVAIVLSCVGIAFTDFEPRNSFDIPYVRDSVDLALFAAVCAIATLALDTLRESLAAEQAARRNAESANRAKDEILAIVSHDLRNPLTTISLSAEQIEQAPASAEVQSHAVRIVAAARTAGQLVEDILAFARVDAGELALDLSAQSVRELLELSCEAATVTAERRHITLESVAIDERAFCDRDRVLQILSNLLGNALKFTPPGGKVSVRAERLGAVIGFEVRDTGPGISRDLSERIFERYYTRDDKRGAGLGLHIARMLVHAQHGEIGVDSEPGSGSTFWFTLPAADAAANVPESQPAGVDLRISAAKSDRTSVRVDELDRLTTSA